MAKTLQITGAIDTDVKKVKDSDETDTCLSLASQKALIAGDIEVSGTHKGVLKIDSTIKSDSEITIDSDGDINLNAAGSDLNIKIGSADTYLNWNSTAGLTIKNISDLDDYFNIQVGSNAQTTISTENDTGDTAHLILQPRGDIVLDPDSGKYIAKKGGTEFSAANSAYAGMILGYTRLEGDLSNQQIYQIQTSMTVEDASHKVTFKTPPSELVEIEATFLINASSTDTRVSVGLSDNSTYNSVAAQFEYDSTGISFGDDEIDDGVRTVKWVLGASQLASIGSSNTFYIGFKCNSSKTVYIQYGLRSTHGIADHPFVIKATALPETIYDGT